ncbi:MULTISPECIES: glycine/sarcosine/betaine reductase component B subunit [Aerococcus]|uniref:Beta-aspartyl-peptidase n=1 Tax=Aerococcus sanguinicola TaxID=119206 RepID=A0A5N1GP67_9LACT|nr:MULTISPECIES: glycine/sarcosine/betaine reductase component B subunit [Aerococcus]KAA9302018.1 beta-aspartyl-peptidase [Aerococcus sanguinicola]MDK6368557.1 glycine/sarcosine/betaine reductase component B subunit [Aerococcus sp. UMB9870]MDK6679640.1 glycine/sarcosine/betaine reductase component B subunit [Aerococcus sp. UMB8608]MDK6686484.1 glycine/sarcosine/betaine reductase component B subunit [Aerococcus sp. UMB8623]MDK6940894.1 glycine/sarcosine/betaine reductase component B subunit [Ae
MKLELQNVVIEKIDFGKKTEIKDDQLYINRDEMIAELMAIDQVKAIQIDLARPGEKKRLIPVKDVIEPRLRIGRGNQFPGITGEIEQLGQGTTKKMQNVAVVTVGDIVGFQEGIIDMWGEGAKWTPFSQTLNVVVNIEPEEGLEPHEHEKACRLVGLKASEYLGAALEGVSPNSRESFEIEDVKTSLEKYPDLPRVAYVEMLIAQGLLHDGYIYGVDAKQILPTLLNPLEELDGAVISGNCVAACDKITTYQHQNNSVILELLKRHGKDLVFVSSILVPELTILDGKFRTADYTVKLCQLLGLDGVIVSEEGYGNPDSDLVMIAEGLENSGIKTVLITDECSGWDGDSQPLADAKEEAKAVISTGNVSHLIHLEAAEEVLGDAKAIANLSGGWEGSLDEAGNISCELNAVIGATSEIGYHNLTVELH